MEQQTLSFYNSIIATSINTPITFTLDGSTLDYPNENDRGKQTRPCTVHNARETTKSPTLADEGFQLFSHNIHFHDVCDETRLQKNIDALQEFVQKQLNATETLFIGHVIRKEDFERYKPSTFVHADWNGVRVQKLGSEDDPLIFTNSDTTTQSVKHFIESTQRWSIYNIWVPLKMVVNRPLALCDIHSVKPDDIIHN